MYFNVSQLLREPSGSTRTFAVSEAFSPSDYGEARLVEGEAQLLRTDRGVWVRAELNSRAQWTCSRCLSDFECPVAMRIDEEFLPHEDPFTGTAVEPSDGDEASFRIGQDHILDLSEAISQYLVLGAPMKPVCREDCAGLCPTCGADLNDSHCSCGVEAGDARWGPLLDLAAGGRIREN